MNDLKPSPTKIRSYRTEKNTNSVAAVCAVTPQTVWRWERGASAPTLLQLRTLAAYYGCEVADLCEVANG